MINYLTPFSGTLSYTSRSLKGRYRGQILYSYLVVILNSVNVVTVIVPSEVFFAKIALLV